MDDNLKKLITCLKMHRPGIYVERFYMKKENCERVLIFLELTHKNTIVLKKYLETNRDWILQ